MRCLIFYLVAYRDYQEYLKKEMTNHTVFISVERQPIKQLN